MIRRLTVEDLWAIAKVDGASVARNGRGVFPVTTADVETDESLTRLYALPEVKPLTSTTSATAPAISPDGSKVGFLRAVDDRAQIHLMAIDGGEPEAISQFPLGATGMVWLPDSSALIVAANVYAPDPERTADIVARRSEEKVSARTTESRFYRFWDTWLTDEYVTHLFRVELDGTCTDLTPDLHAFVSLPSSGAVTSQFDVSPDSSRVVLSAASIEYGTLPRPRFELWEVPTSPGTSRRLTPDNAGDDTQPLFLEDGRIVFGAQTELEFYASPTFLTVLDGSGTQTRLAQGWDLSPVSWIADPAGEAIIAAAEHRIQFKLYRVPLDGQPPSVISRAHSGSQPAATHDTLYFIEQSVSHPPTLVATDLHGEDRRQISTFNDQLMTSVQLGEVEDTTFAGADGAEVQMLIVYPPDFDDKKQWPLVHMIHGGPHGSFGDVWHQRWNSHVFSAPGYVVAMVNFHGSTSFGADFTASITGAWGDKPTADVLAATDQLVSRGFIDEGRMAITGGSYGGYLTAWIATQDQRFACAIAHAAVINLGAMYASDWTTGLGKSAGARPWEDPIRNARWSPSFHYQEYATPTLVIHGERDFRVPVNQGLELYGVLKAKGIDARLVYYPDENHWILKPNNSIHWYSEVHNWLRRYLD